MTNPKAPRKEAKFAFFGRQIKKSNGRLYEISNRLIFLVNTLKNVKYDYFLGALILACAAASLAIGTLNGEQET